MPKYTKSKPNIHFNGKSCTYYNMDYLYAKIELQVRGDDLYGIFTQALKRKGKEMLCLENFKDKTLIEVLGDTDLGVHFEDAMRDVWHYFKLPFGYVVPKLKNLT